MPTIDNNSNLYILAGTQRPVAARAVADPSQDNRPSSVASPSVAPAAIEPANDVKKQQLLQRYSEQNSSSSGSLGYPQQRAVEAYSQHAQQDELQQLQDMLGIDVYI